MKDPTEKRSSKAIMMGALIDESKVKNVFILGRGRMGNAIKERFRCMQPAGYRARLSGLDAFMAKDSAIQKANIIFFCKADPEK